MCVYIYMYMCVYTCVYMYSYIQFAFNIILYQFKIYSIVVGQSPKLYKVFPSYLQYLPGTIQNYFNVNDYISYTRKMLTVKVQNRKINNKQYVCNNGKSHKEQSYHTGGDDKTIS